MESDQAIKTEKKQKSPRSEIVELHPTKPDITGPKQVEESNKRSRKEWEKTFNVMSDWVVLIDLKGRIIRSNHAGQNFTGKSLAEISGQSLCKLVHGSEKYIAGCPKVKMLQTGKCESTELQVPGTEKWLMVTVDPVTDKEGKLTGVVHITRDITGQKKTETSLKESEEKYRLITEASQHGIFRFDMNGILTFANMAASEITGYDMEEVEKGTLSLEKFYTGDALHGIIKDLEILRSGKPVKNENILTRSDGTKINVVYSCAPILKKGECVGFTGTLEDITERKKAEEALRESEEKYRSIFNTAASLITSISANGVIVGCNARIKDVLDYERDEVVGQSIAKILHPDYTERAKTCLNEVLTVGFARHKEYKMVRKDNKIIDVEINAAGIKNKQGKYVEGICIIEDITERKKAQEALAESEEKFRSIFDNANDVIVSVTKTGKLVRVNKKVEGILGYKPDELVGKNVLTSGILAKKNVATIVKLFKEVLKKGGLLDIRDGRNVTEVWINHKDGHTVLLEASTTTIKEDGKLEGFLSVLRDITERKRAEEAYRSLVNHSLQGLAIFQNGRVVFANQTMADIVGYTVEEMLTLPPEKVEAFVHPNDRVLVWNRHRDRLNGEEPPERYELRGIRKDGAVCWLEIHASLIEYQGKPAIQAAYVDITQRKKAEDARAKSEQELRIRNRINNIFLTVPDEKMYAEVLNLVLEVMESEFGTFGYFKEDGVFVVPAMTRNIFWEKCNVPEKDIIFERGTFGGIWNKAIKERKTLFANEGPFNTPKGHVPITNTMVTPIIYRDKIISAIHIANKPGGYDEAKRAMLETLARHIAPVLHGRLQANKQEKERRLAEDTLKESEEHYRMLAERMNDGLGQMDETGTYVYVNNKFGEMLGHSPDEMIGRPWTDFFDEDAQKIINEQLLQRKKGSSGPYEVMNTRSDGQKIFIRMSPQVIFDEDGKFKGSFAIVTDITQRKKAQEEIENLAKFPSENPYPILRISGDGTILYANAASAALLKDRKSGIDQPAPQQWRRVVENVLASGSVERMEVTHKERVFAFRAIPVTAAGYVNFYGVDITERKRAEEQIRQQHEFLNNVLESLTHPFYVIDVNDYTITLMNSAANLNDAPIRSTCYALTHRRNRPCAGKGIQCPLEEVKKTGKPATAEHIHYDKDGIARHIEVHGYPMFDNQGNVSQMIEYCLDISKRKQAEKELLEYQGQLRRLASQLSESEEQEKRRIVVGLHDEITQPLVFLDVKLASLFKTDAGIKPPDSFKEIQGIVARLLHQIRHMTFDLSNPLLYELGLEAALKD